MAKFDRFTKALALGNFRQAYKILVGDEEGFSLCVHRECNNMFACHGHCVCLIGICVLP
jgi:hypothetical protein